MHQTLLTKIKATLANVTKVKLVFSYPKTKIDQFPAVFIMPGFMQNSYLTTVENEKVYQYQLYVLIGMQEGQAENIFTNVLPNTVDAIVAQFDSEWNGGTIDGHRVTVLVSSNEAWGVSEEEDGLKAFAPMTVQVRLVSDN